MNPEHLLERLYAQRPELRGLAWSVERAGLVGPPGGTAASLERWTFSIVLPHDEDDPDERQPARALKLTLDRDGNIVKTIGTKQRGVAGGPPREEKP